MQNSNNKDKRLYSSLNISLDTVQILDNLYNQVFQYIKQNLLFDLFSLKHHHN